jgi:ubiquinone/menaquinone biosynthesis C-methylase UbiE
MDEQQHKIELQREYSLRFSAQQQYRNAVWKILTAEFFQKFIPPDSTVLDLGSGWGEFINNIRAAKKYGMDLNPEGRARLAADVEFLEQDCSKEWQVGENSLDFVFTSNFFEHLRTKDDLRRTLAEARRCLKPDGKIICMGPNIKYLPGLYWDFWDHYLPLTELSLQEGLELLGFEVETCIARFLPYTMARGPQPPLSLVHWYLKAPALWRIRGRQFLVVARAGKTA